MLRTPIIALPLLFYLIQTLLWPPFEPLSDPQHHWIDPRGATTFRVEAHSSLDLLPSLDSDLLPFPFVYPPSALAVPPLLVSGQHLPLLPSQSHLRRPLPSPFQSTTSRVKADPSSAFLLCSDPIPFFVHFPLAIAEPSVLVSRHRLSSLPVLAHL